MRSTTKLLFSLGLVLILGTGLAVSTGTAAGAADPDDDAPPAWFLEHNEFLARDGGVFHADNSEYRSEAEPWDAYGLAWEEGPTRNTLHGRLFGLRDGADVATFWDFFIFWHPGERQAYIYQVGNDGALGVATLDPPGPDGATRSEGVLYRVDGSTPPRIAHDARNHDEIHDTQSFDWIEGVWKPRRAYTWKRVK
jgi:hypothetical protein